MSRTCPGHVSRICVVNFFKILPRCRCMSSWPCFGPRKTWIRPDFWISKPIFIYMYSHDVYYIFNWFSAKNLHLSSIWIIIFEVWGYGKVFFFLDHFFQSSVICDLSKVWEFHAWKGDPDKTNHVENLLPTRPTRSLTQGNAKSADGIFHIFNNMDFS